MLRSMRPLSPQKMMPAVPAIIKVMPSNVKDNPHVRNAVILLVLKIGNLFTPSFVQAKKGKNVKM